VIGRLVAIAILLAVLFLVGEQHMWQNYFDCLNDPSQSLGACHAPTWGGW